MPTKTIAASTSIGGVTIAGSLSRTGSGQVSNQTDPVLAAGKAGTLTTRTDANTGVVTLSTGHGITTGMVISLFWDGGSRYGMTTVVATNAVTIDLGAGTDLPAATTAVVMAEETVWDVDFTGDLVVLAMVTASRRGRVVFQLNDGTLVKALDLGLSGNDGECWLWVDDSDVTNPFAGVSVGKITIANGHATLTNTISFGALLDS